MNFTNWLLFVANLPGRNQTLRMRVWRSLKASGAAALRDGVYVLPASAAARVLFERQSQDIQEGGGTAYILELAGHTDSGGHGDGLRTLFDRTAEYQTVASKLQTLRRDLGKLEELDARRRLSAINREVVALTAVDFFPGESRAQVE